MGATKRLTVFWGQERPKRYLLVGDNWFEVFGRNTDKIYEVFAMIQERRAGIRRSDRTA